MTLILAKDERQLNFLSSEVASCSSLDVDAMKHLHQQLLAVTNTFESMVKNKYTPIIDN